MQALRELVIHRCAKFFTSNMIVQHGVHAMMVMFGYTISLSLGSLQCFGFQNMPMLRGKVLPNWAFFTDKPYTLKQCYEECSANKLCHSLNFKSDVLECSLNGAKKNDVSDDVIDYETGFYVERGSLDKPLSGRFSCTLYHRDLDVSCIQAFNVPCSNIDCGWDKRCFVKHSSTFCAKPGLEISKPTPVSNAAPYTIHYSDSHPRLVARYTCDGLYDDTNKLEVSSIYVFQNSTWSSPCAMDCQYTGTFPTVIEQSTGTLQSQQHPNNYPSNIEQVYVIKGSPGSKVAVTIVLLDTEKDYDFVKVHDGCSSTSPVIGNFSGQSTNIQLQSTQNHVWIRFASDDLVSGQGFNINYAIVSQFQ